MIEWQWRVAQLLVWMQFYSLTVVRKRNATEQRNIIAASLRKGKTWIICSATKPTWPFTAIGPGESNAHRNGAKSESMTQQKTSKRIRKQNMVLIENTINVKMIFDFRQQAYNNAVVHISSSKPSMCSAQVHMVTQRWENIRHHVVHMEKWEHLQF